MATITYSSAAQIYFAAQILISCKDMCPSVLVTIPHIKKWALVHRGSQKPTTAQPYVQMS